MHWTKHNISTSSLLACVQSSPNITAHEQKYIVNKHQQQMNMVTTHNNPYEHTYFHSKSQHNHTNNSDNSPNALQTPHTFSSITIINITPHSLRGVEAITSVIQVIYRGKFTPAYIHTKSQHNHTNNTDNSPNASQTPYTCSSITIINITPHSLRGVETITSVIQAI